MPSLQLWGRRRGPSVAPGAQTQSSVEGIQVSAIAFGESYFEKAFSCCRHFGSEQRSCRPPTWPSRPDPQGTRRTSLRLDWLLYRRECRHWHRPRSDGPAVLWATQGIAANLSPFGAIGGVQAGYNWQVNKDWLVGVEVDAQASGQRDDGTCLLGCVAGFATQFDQKIDWFGTARARVGLVEGPVLSYVTGGLAYGTFSTSRCEKHYPPMSRKDCATTGDWRLFRARKPTWIYVRKWSRSLAWRQLDRKDRVSFRRSRQPDLQFHLQCGSPNAEHAVVTTSSAVV